MGRIRSNGKKRRARHREIVEETLERLVGSDDEGTGIYEESDYDGLIDEAHLDLFVQWYAFGGIQRGLSPLEILALPPALATDFLYLLGVLGRLRGEQDTRRGMSDWKK